MIVLMTKYKELYRIIKDFFVLNSIVLINKWSTFSWGLGILPTANCVIPGYFHWKQIENRTQLLNSLLIIIYLATWKLSGCPDYENSNNILMVDDETDAGL